jgi:hypothetical protein
MNEITKLKELEVKYTLPTVTYNLTELESDIDKLTQQYSGFVVKENDVKTAKELTAKLNKLSKAINDKKIAVTKEIKATLTPFESKIKILVGNITDLSKSIKNQLDTFNEKEKHEKRMSIIQSGLWVNYMVFDDKWLNKGAKLVDIFANLEAQKTIFQNNCLLIKTTCKGYSLNHNKYLQLLSEKTEVQVIVDKIAEDYKLIQDQENKAGDEILEIETIVTDPYFSVEEAQDTTKLVYLLKVTATRTKLKALKEFMVSNGLEYEKVEG